ncbi:hypothetical protein LINGRAHAP2_LOCUS21435 [Linum grandiflorum]
MPSQPRKRRRINKPLKVESKNPTDEAAAIRSGLKDAERGRSSSNNKNVRVDPKIEQGKKCAVAEAQKDRCTGNYKIFDSPFENYLLPVVPSRADLSPNS